MRNVESRPARGGLRTRILCVTKEKDHDETGSPRKKDREPSEAEKTMVIWKEEEETRRWRRGEKERH